VQAGYTAVAQDVRGRYTSEGKFKPHVQETDDGVDMFSWTAVQPWSNGIVGTFGGSYLGCTQWLPARENPAALRAMTPSITLSDP
jgi:putative CocE/NonD family hydrolase